MATSEKEIVKQRTILAQYNSSDIEDEDLHDFIWDDFLCEVDTMIKKMRTKKFFAYGLSLTWRNVAGYTEFETESASVLVNKITPNSEFSIKFLATENKGIIEVITSHHDAPMGETMYLMSQSMEKKQGIKESYFN